MKRICVVRFCGSWKAFPQFKAAIMVTTAMLVLFALDVHAQAQDGGDAGIRDATARVSNYFDVGTSLIYAIGAVAGLVGAVKVYTKWNSGDQDTMKVASGWFGSCIFLVVVATVLRAFFLN